ncbi:hypothetical protein PAHAL_6G180600 [Panicum hallii]|uniref:Cytochrome P450 71A1 n=1 Tax=Panicum hallii TaxID=206008 RepID=A0A2S3I266_9POAL|nr:cytochrome P450 71A1-like [Panicum hallii]PAN35096.1 hypothetical protein PAHAL_6G180600 [Panicum hallii]
MEVSPFLALLLLALLSLLLFFFSAGRKTSPSYAGGRSLPPSPPGFPLLGHLPLLGSLPHRALLSLAASHGPVMLLRLGRVPAVVVSSADAAREALKTRDPAFASRFRSRMTERLFYGCDMAFAPYGEHWRRARRVCVLHLLSQRCVLSFRRVREQEAAALVGRVRAAARDGAVNLSDLLISYASSVTIRAAFGDCSSYGLGGGGKVRKVFDDLEEMLGSGTLGELVPWLAWVDTLTGLDAKATRTFEALDGLLEQVIADHRERRRGGQRVGDDGGQRDFVDVLLDVNEEEDEAGGLWFDTVTIKAIVMNMFVGGIDTTFASLEWAMAELINHPDEMRRLQEEIRAAVRDDDHIIEDHLNKLHYLKLVIKETLRLHPPVPLVPRETVEDAELLGYHVPARTRILVNVWAIGREPTTWERAEKFLPERFAEDVDMDQYMLGQDFKLLPFGAGRRGCPGAGFAMASVELVLANLLYHFNWSLPGGASMVNMDEQGGLAVRLKKTLHLVAMPWCSE